MAPPHSASSLPAAVPALLLLLLFFAALSTAAVAAARPAFPAGISPLRRHSSGRYAVAADGSGNATAAAAAAAAAKPFTAHYFRQELDHFTFTPNASRIFSQKYLINDTFWRKPTGDAGAGAGPLFVYTGNEGDIEWFATNTGFMFDIAPQFGALLVFIEHRFYGESMPFGNDSDKSAATLGYLTSTQALADFAVLITSLKHNLSVPDAPVVVFGGSYGGMLASWFRLKYPHVAMGALASSAPSSPEALPTRTSAAGAPLAGGDAANQPWRSPPVLVVRIGDRVAWDFSFSMFGRSPLSYSLDKAGQRSLPYVAEVQADGK